MKIKRNGVILESSNPLVINQWKKAGYTEVRSEDELLNGSEPQGDNEPPKDDEPLNDGEDPKDGELLCDDEPQGDKTKKGRKKAQE